MLLENLKKKLLNLKEEEMKRLLMSVGFGALVAITLPIATLVGTSSYTMSNFDQAGAMRRLVRLNTSISLIPSLIAGTVAGIGSWVTAGNYSQNLQRRGILKKLSDDEIQLLLTANEIDVEYRIEVLQIAALAKRKDLDVLPILRETIEEST